MASVTLGGNPVALHGDLPAVGAAAPDFNLTNSDLGDVGLKDFAGKKIILNIFVSIDTPTCATSTAGRSPWSATGLHPIVNSMVRKSSRPRTALDDLSKLLIIF